MPLLNPCLAASSGCANGAGVFARNPLQGAKRLKLGGRRSEVRGGRALSHPRGTNASQKLSLSHRAEVHDLLGFFRMRVQIDDVAPGVENAQSVHEAALAEL